MTIKDYFRALSILYIALLSGQFLFLLVVFYLHSSGTSGLPFADDEFTQALMYAGPLFVIGGLSASFIVVKARLNAVKKAGSLKEKLESYKGVLIMKYAFLECPSFFAIMSYMLTGHYIFLVLAGLMILVFIVNKPSQEKASEELELSPEQRTLFNNPESHI